MDSLKEKVTKIVADYAIGGSNAHLYFTTSLDGNFLTVIGVGKIKGQHFVTTALVVEIMGEHIIVHQDLTDKIVADALMQAGIPRLQIILAYMGESIPEAA
jgi:hypothetical protein